MSLVPAASLNPGHRPSLVTALSKRCAERWDADAIACATQASAAAELAACPEAVSFIVEPVTLRHHQRSFDAVFRVLNLSANLQRGSLCVRFGNAAGEELEHLFSSQQAVPAGAAVQVAVSAPLPVERWNQTHSIYPYMAPYGCTDPPDEAPSLALPFDKSGKPLSP
jgi:hypothetical protein